MVATRPLISESSTPYTTPLVTVPSTPITIGIIVTFMFHSFYSPLARSEYLPPFSLSFSFNLWSGGTENLLLDSFSFLFFFFFSFLLLTISRSGLLVDVRRSVCISKSQRVLSVSFFRTDSGWCIYPLFVWSHFNFFRNFQWITFLIQLYLVLDSFCSKLLNSLIIRLLVSSLLSHSQQLSFYSVLRIIALTLLILLGFVFCCC